MISKLTEQIPKRERFIILAREPSPITRRFESIFSSHGQVEVIVDSEPSSGDSSIWYPDEEVVGYHGLLDTFFPKSSCTSWGRAMFHLSKTLRSHEAVWFIEDDVAGNSAFFAELIELTAEVNADLSACYIWPLEKNIRPHNHLAEPWFNEPWQGFLPLCRMSVRMIQEALDFREKNGQFAFLEVIFSSLVNEKGLTYLDWRKKAASHRLFSTFHYRPEIEVIRPGICHPVKKAEIHVEICTLKDQPGPKPGPILAEAEKLITRYIGTSRGRWFEGENFYWWKVWFPTPQPIKALEIRAGDGISVNLMLDAIFTDEGSRVHCIDNYDDQELTLEIFNKNAKSGGHEDKLSLYEGATPEILAWMITEEGYWESFDFIHQAKNDTPAELLANACQAWPLLKTQGVMVFSDIEDSKSKAALNAFLAAYSDQLQIARTSNKEIIAVVKVPRDESTREVVSLETMTPENLGGRGNDKGAPEGVSPLEA